MDRRNAQTPGETTTRPPNLSRFLAEVEAALMAASASPDAMRTAAEVMRRCRDHVGGPSKTAPQTLPVCSNVAAALANPPKGREAVADAFAAITPGLRWYRRHGADPANLPFWNGHANAMLFGPGGLEERDDLWIGVTVIAANVTYPDHDHAPEEVYLALSPGEWWNAAMPWTDPGPAGLIYNPPGIRHAMRSGPAPFLALWFLPLG